MPVRNIYLTGFLLILPLIKIACQHQTYSLNTEAAPGYVSPGKMPFWLRANRFGSVPSDNASLSLVLSAKKDYKTEKENLFDWGASFEGRLNAGSKTRFILVEGYGKIRLGVFEFRAGRSKEITGLCDTTLSSGSWSFSGNALGVPKVQLSVPAYYSIPWFGKLFAIKGNYAFGWMGLVQKRAWRQPDDTVLLGTYLHHLSLYGRFGKPAWRLHLFGGLNHQVQWGHEKEFFGDEFPLSPFKTYLFAITGKNYYYDYYGSTHHTNIGNQLGSLDVGLEYAFRRIKILVYRQSLYETGSLFHLANIQDGLNGISIEKRSKGRHALDWQKILFEFLYTKNQAGEPWSKPTSAPFEPYYNHYNYIEGWSYKGIGIGSPFISTRDYLREELPTWPAEYFVNNRVRVFHAGLEGTAWHWEFVMKASFSNNYGTYYTTDEEQTTDIPDPGSLGVFGKKDQFSAYLDCKRAFGKGFHIGITAAADVGELFYDSFGIIVSLSKRF